MFIYDFKLKLTEFTKIGLRLLIKKKKQHTANKLKQ